MESFGVLGWWLAGLSVVLIAVSLIGMRVADRRYSFRGGVVSGVVGRMGQGKSLFVVARVLIPAAKALHSRRGLHCRFSGRQVRSIVCNFRLTLPWDVPTVFLDGTRLWDHLLEVDPDLCAELHPDDDDHRPGCYVNGDALVVIDEAHLFLPAGKQRIDPAAAYFLSMARKLNCEVWWITQNPMKVHKRVRDDSAYLWQVERASGLWTILTGPSRSFVARLFEPEDYGRTSATPLDRKWYRLNKTTVSVYNSFDLIVPDPEDRSRSALAQPANFPRNAKRDPGGRGPASLRPVERPSDDAIAN